MDRYQTAKAWTCFRGLLLKILGSSSQFREIQPAGWLREVLYVVKTRTIRKWELSACDKFVNLRKEDFFVSRRHSILYTM